MRLFAALQLLECNTSARKLTLGHFNQPLLPSDLARNLMNACSFCVVAASFAFLSKFQSNVCNANSPDIYVRMHIPQIQLRQCVWLLVVAIEFWVRRMEYAIGIKKSFLNTRSRFDVIPMIWWLWTIQLLPWEINIAFLLATRTVGIASMTCIKKRPCFSNFCIVMK